MKQIPFRFAPVPDELLWDVSVPAEVKVLWAAIYRMADRAGTTVVPQDELAKALGYSDRTLRSWLRRGEALGYIRTWQRGQNLSNEYEAVLPGPEETFRTGPEETFRTERKKLSGPSSSLEIEKKTDARVSSTDSSFDAFWTAYPRHTDKGHARPAYARALKRATADEILAGLTRNLPVLAAQEARFVPHAATWLNGDRWTDEPAKAKAKKHWGEELMEQYQ